MAITGHLLCGVCTPSALPTMSNIPFTEFSQSKEGVQF